MKQRQHCLVAILEFKGSPWAEELGLGNGLSTRPDANVHRSGGASVCKESACDSSLQTACRTA